MFYLLTTGLAKLLLASILPNLSDRSKNSQIYQIVQKFVIAEPYQIIRIKFQQVRFGQNCQRFVITKFFAIAIAYSLLEK